MEKKKNLVIPAILCLALCLSAGFAQEQKAIDLPAPQKTGGMPLMEALAKRQTVREFSPKELPDRVLSNLLWAAFGVNRSDGKRTAPSAMNCQEIDIYAATAKGVFLYDAKANLLKPVTTEDIRVAAGQQAFVKTAPVLLIFAADYNRMRGPDSGKDFYSATDAGFISQNVYLFCASEDLATVVLGMVNRDVVIKKLGLADSVKIILAQPVGYRAR